MGLVVIVKLELVIIEGSSDVVGNNNIMAAAILVGSFENTDLYFCKQLAKGPLQLPL